MLGLLLMAAAVQAQPHEDPCVRADACRYVGDVIIENPDGKRITLPVNKTLPWVVQDNLLLVPGDWIIIRLVDRAGALVPQLVKAGANGGAPDPGDGEIRVKVHAFDKGNLIMEVLSRRPETLDYAALVVTGINKPQRTSTCSLMPGVASFESWKWPIRQIALYGFRPTSAMRCKILDVKQDEKGQ